MKRNVSILLLLVLLMNTFTNSLMIPTTTAESDTSAIDKIGFVGDEGTVTLEEAEGEGELIVSWITNTIDTSNEFNETIDLPDHIQVDDESGELINKDGETSVGSFELENRTLSLLFDQDITSDARGQLRFSAAVDQEDLEETENTTADDETSLTEDEDSDSDKSNDDTSEDSDLDNTSENEAAFSITNYEDDANITDDFFIETTVKKDGDVLDDGTEIIVEAPFSNTSLELIYDFELTNGHSYGNGSTYTIEVPSMFTIPNIPESDPQPLERADGVKFGSYYTNGNDIVITFNETITQESNIAGNITLDAIFDDDYDGPATGDPVVFPYGENDTIEFPISFQPDENGLDKQGIGNRGYNTEFITWTIDVNKNLQLMENVILNDFAAQGDHQIIDDSFKVYELSMNADGSYDESMNDVTDSVLGDRFTLDVDEFGESFELDMGDLNQEAYQIQYQTSVNDRVGTEYKNNASLNYADGDDLTTESTVSVTRGNPLAKEAVDYDDVNQTIDWEVLYNYDEKEIEQDRAFLNDTFEDQNQRLIEESMEVYLVSIDPDTGDETGEELFENYTLTTDGTNGYHIQFDESINEPFKIRYQTETLDRVSEDGVVTNTIEDDFDNESEGSQDIGQGILIKANTDTDYKEKTTDWSVTMNRDLAVMEDVTFNDTLPDGFTFDQDSFAINGYIGDYNVNYNDDNNEVTIEFLDDITEQVTLSYSTAVDFDVAGREDSYTNSARVDWIPEGEEESVSKTGTASFNPDDSTKNNGFKFGSYNIQDKEITWTIGVNYNNETLNGVIVEDPILGDQNFDIDDVNIYEMELTGEEDGFEYGNDVTDQYTIDTLPNDPGFSVDFGDIQNGFIIEFTTDLEDTVIESTYDNTATIESSNRDDATLDASLSPRFGGEYTTKSASQSSENGRIVNWEVNINRSQSTLNNIEITDTPSINQTILQDTLTIYETTATDEAIEKNPDQVLEQGTDYTIDFTQDEDGQESFVIEFIGDKEMIDRAYVLEYDTYILYSGDTGSISNDLSIEGQQVEDDDGDSSVDQAINFSNISGSISGEVGSLNISKLDAEDNDVTLEGAEFHLYDEDGVLLRTGETDSDGELRFVNLLFGDYQLEEVTAPDGYTIDPTTDNPREVTVGSGSDGNNVTDIDVENYEIKRDVELTKVDGTTDEPLADAGFTLYDSDDNEIESETTTDENGIIYLEGLEPGDYYFVETTPPEHYQDNSNEYHFTINENHTILDIEEDAITVENELIPGSAFMKKIDADTTDDEIGLEGATFLITNIDEDPEIDFDRTVTSDEDGQIETSNLRPGTYTIEEVSAPNGFKLSGQDPIEFEIERSQDDPIEISSDPFENNVRTTSVEITKTDSVNEQLLADAEFELTYAEGDYELESSPQTATTDENGIATFDDLKPGTYEVVETQSPEGYIADDTPIEVTVTLGDVHNERTVGVDFNNDPYANITLIKVDSETGVSLEGAIFALEDTDGNEIDGFQELETDSEGKISISGLPDGEYQVREIEAPDGYTIQDGSYTSESFTVDSDVDETEQIELEDVDNDIIRGSVSLVKTDGETEEPLEGVEFELTAIDLVNGGTYTETTYTTDENGEVVVEDLRPGEYEFIETSPLEGYQDHVGDITFELEFPHDQEQIEIEIANYQLVNIPVEKTWNDDDQEEERPEEITVQLLRNGVNTDETLDLSSDNDWEDSFEDLEAIDENSEFYTYSVEELDPGTDYQLQAISGDQENGFEIQNVITQSLSVEKEWLDASEDDRPDDITITLYQNDTEFDSLTLNADDQWEATFDDLPIYDTDGIVYDYHVEEESVDQYDLVGITEAEAGFAIENVRVGETEVTGDKTWLDDDASDRPESITVNLLQNEEEIDSQQVTSDDEWSYSFDELDAFDDEGHPYDYKVEEEAIDGYETSIDGYDITNLRIGEIEVAGEKTWLDDDTSDRPESITVNLLQNGEEIDTQQVTSDDGWTFSFTELDEFDEEGARFEYSINEEPVDGYETTIEEFDITNIRVDETEVSGEKTWLDDDSSDRPDEITVNLLQNGEHIDNQQVSSGDDWTFSFTELDQFDQDGQSYNYTVEEEALDGYETIINGYNITNVRSGQTEVSGEKTWLDDNSSDRPESISVHLLQNGEPIDTQQVTSDDDWSYSFTGLDEFDNEGVRYDYSIDEESVDGYETLIDGYDLENLRVGTLEIEGEKTWLDDDTSDRPDEITVNLLQDGVVIETLDVAAEDDWAYQFSDVPEFDEEGVRYEYTVTEHGVPGYETLIDGYDVINTRTGLTNANVTKSWLDDDTPDRPDDITIHLLRNGEVLDTVELSDATEWNYTFEDLEAFDDEGQPYEYTVEEEAVDGYETMIDGYDITNVRSGDTEVSGEKIWLDDDPSDRPESITVNLLQNGEEIDSQQVTSGDDWNFSFTDLDEFDEEGTRFEYSIEEEPVDGYDTTIEGFNITNLRVGETDVTGEKTWLDDDNPDRPESITVHLLQNGEQIDEQEVTADDDWNFSFTDLDEFDDEGARFDYTIEEEPIDGYEAMMDGYNITNRRIGETSVTGEKIWVDDDASDRPASITVHLLQNGELISSKEVSANDDWIFSFDHLAKYDEHGALFNYTIEEEPVDGYQASIDGYEITNTKEDSPAVDESDDESSTDGTLPDTASNLYHYLLMGAAFLLIGSAGLVHNHLKKGKNQ
ncbi:conserved repeat domain-containing protein [Pelagirhabdus alkalitolerans]|uniref:Conserved repeat domain-containing protein n=1 Tax=Pelagirhabdus alkalitolerans TaxID=1612202 RepID=A0A1G6GQT2_9BACI|nr:Cna B-type domain-containing protein [Pelagirhabdus alkalitolerans]SDB84314.1 conserved repeat domain-containing protein [Pelagirhabdus alkalitolerans]